MMESARALREVIEKARRTHTATLCLVLRVIPQELVHGKLNIIKSKKPRQEKKNRLKSDREERETQLEIGQGEKGEW